MIIIYEEYWSESVAAGRGGEGAQKLVRNLIVWKVKLIDKSGISLT